MTRLPPSTTWSVVLIAGIALAAACAESGDGDIAAADSGAADSGVTTDSGAADSGGSDTGDGASDTGASGTDSGDTGDSGDPGADTGDSGDTGWGPSTRWVGVSTSGYEAVAVTDAGRLACWGRPGKSTEACPTTGGFIEAGQGYYHGCAVDASGAVTCWHQEGKDWAENDFGQADPPDGVFHGLDAVFGETCAIDDGDQAQCWGNFEWGGSAPVPAEEYQSVSIGYGAAFGLTRAGNIVAWGYLDDDLPMLSVPTDGPYTAVAAGVSHGCALDGEGRATCWGGEHRDTIQAPQDVRFLSIDAGWESTCGITTDQAVRCWETHSDPDVAQGVESDAPTGGTWGSVSVGIEAACAISTDGELTCWGAYVTRNGLMPVPDLPE